MSVAHLDGRAPGEITLVNSSTFNNMSVHVALCLLAPRVASPLMVTAADTLGFPWLCFTREEAASQEQPRATQLGEALAGLESRPCGLLGNVGSSLFTGILLFHGSKTPLGIPLLSTDVIL